MSKRKKFLIYILLLICILFWPPFSLYSQQESAKLVEQSGSFSILSTAPIENTPAPQLVVNLDFKDADIKDVARAFSRISGVNIIVSDEVKAKITLNVQSINWREALQMILGAYNLTAIEKENYIIITTLERRRLGEESGDLQTRVTTLNFVDIAEVQKSLASILTKRGKIETDVRTNSLIITDIPERINQIQEVTLKLDTRTPQVMIEAMMLTIKLNKDEKLGINWDMIHKNRPQREIIQDLDIGGTSGSDFFWQLKYGKTILPWANISAVIDLLVEEKRAEVLANPRVLTLDNLAATIDLTEQVPYKQQVTSTESASSVSSTQFKDIPVKLSVKPHITKDNYIFMNIKTEQSYLAGYTSDAQPIIDTRKAETNVLVRNGETVVIGGLRKKEKTSIVDKLPILGGIPFIGVLFKKTVVAEVDTELLIFVTPYVASDLRMTAQEMTKLDRINQIKQETKEVLKNAQPFSLRLHFMKNK